MIRTAALAVLGLGYLCAQPADTGKRQFQAHCIGCHGEDGNGGARGPGIVDLRQFRAASAESVREVILNGIPNAGMPAFHIPDPEADAIAAYVLELRASRGAVTASDIGRGDAAAGERFFAGKGNCASCHMVRGRGGVLGPDLSNIGRDRTAAQIEQALRDPGHRQRCRQAAAARSGRGASYHAVTVRLRNGADPPRHREKRKRVRPAIAGHGRQAAPAFEGPGGRESPARKSLMPKVRRDAGGNARPGRLPQPSDVRNGSASPTARNRAQACLRRCGVIPSPAAGRPITATRAATASARSTRSTRAT